MPDIRARSNSELLDAAFEIYRQNFVVLASVNVFAVIAHTIGSYMSRWGILHQQADMITASYLVRAAGFLISPFTDATLVCVASAAYLGMPVELSDALRTALRRPFRLFVAIVLRGILMAIGLMLLIVPGLVVYKRYFALPMTFVLEGNDIGEAFSRSEDLAVDNGGRIFGFLFVTAAVVSVGTTLIAAVIGSAIQSEIVAAVVALIILTAMTSFTTIVNTLLYYDIRVRKEGLDIELMSRALETPPLNPSTSAVTP